MKQSDGKQAHWGAVEWFQQKLERQDNNSAAAYFGHARSAYQHMRHGFVIDHLAASLPFEPAEIIDYGCATGELTAALSARFPRARMQGYDFVPGLIDQARVDHPAISFGVNALPNIPLAPGERSVAVLSEVLYYLPEAERRRTLDALLEKSGNAFAISLSSTIGDRYFTPESAEALLKSYGLETSATILRTPKLIYMLGVCNRVEAVCAGAAAGSDGKRRIERLARQAWGIAPLRWGMSAVRALANGVAGSSTLVSLFSWVENDLGLGRRPTNVVVVGVKPLANGAADS